MEDKHHFFASDIACQQIAQQLINRNTPSSYLRIGVQGGGCSGYKYFLQFEDKDPSNKDLIFKIGNIKIIIDKKSILYLNGSTLEWESTLLHRGFKIVNSNEISKCGCGMSVVFK